MEEIDAKSIAQEGGIPVRSLYTAIDSSITKGIVVKPRSRIRRDSSIFLADKNIPEKFLSASVFILQWHITNVCDLHCKHCYDRSQRSPLTLEQGIKVLDDLQSFCQKRYVRGHVCFTGGNPLMYPKFN